LKKPTLAKIALMRNLFSITSGAIAVLVLVIGTSLTSAQTNAQKDTSQPSGKEVPPDVPDTIAAPASEEVILYAHATGSQIYTCQAAAGDRFSWTLKGPDAELHDRKDKVIGQHSAGPTWKLKDGSQVTGKAAAQVESLDANSIPWLLVKVTSHAGKGTLTDVTTIQRVHTKGGKPPTEGCDAAHKDTEAKSSYSADYYFYAPAK
jgi:hypothetical protein